ncbi:uncharacterized protein LOC144883011 [Branchiostoma floridae x Branchiostoma japonicum]
MAILMTMASSYAWLLLLSAVNLGESAACTNGGTYTTSSNATITTDNYPSFYPKSSCTWSLEVTSGSVILLKFSSFDIEEFGNCAFENVIIYDGNTTGTTLGQFCGTILPPAMLSTSNTMTVVLTTFGFSNTEYTGFSASFTEQSPSSGLDSGCSNLATWTGTAAGSIASMYYGTSANYDDNAYCKWEITVAPGKYVNLTFHRTFWVDPFCVEADRVTVYSGVTTGLTELDSFCGHTVPSSLQSCSNKMTVEFTSDSSNEYTGFLASFSQSDTDPACASGTASMTSTAERTSSAAMTTGSTTTRQVTTPVRMVSTASTQSPSTSRTTSSTTTAPQPSTSRTTSSTTTAPQSSTSRTTSSTTTAPQSSTSRTTTTTSPSSTSRTTASTTTPQISTTRTTTSTTITPAQSTSRTTTATSPPSTPSTPSTPLERTRTTTSPSSTSRTTTTTTPTTSPPSFTSRTTTSAAPGVSATHRTTTAETTRTNPSGPTSSATQHVTTSSTHTSGGSAVYTATTTSAQATTSGRGTHAATTTGSTKASKKNVVQLWVIGSVVGSGMGAIVVATMTIFCCCLKKDANRVTTV